MSNISLTLGKNLQVEPVESVTISWNEGIKVQRLKRFLLNQEDCLWPREIAIWNKVKDYDKWLYCFAGHIDDEMSIDECYNVSKKEKEQLKADSLGLRILNIERIRKGTDIKLDFGKVDTQTIETRIKQHFTNEDYLELFRKQAYIFFPSNIEPFNKDKGSDFIDSLETILIKGNVDENENRMGVCNKQKIQDPELLFPIQEVINSNACRAIETDIKVSIIRK